MTTRLDDKPGQMKTAEDAEDFDIQVSASLASSVVLIYARNSSNSLIYKYLTVKSLIRSKIWQKLR